MPYQCIKTDKPKQIGNRIFILKCLDSYIFLSMEIKCTEINRAKNIFYPINICKSKTSYAQYGAQVIILQEQSTEHYHILGILFIFHWQHIKSVC